MIGRLKRALRKLRETLRAMIFREKNKNMTRHNQEILDCLNDYLRVRKPGYAVLLRGSWGSGKTFFVKEWLDALKAKKDDDDDFYTLAPIYVSLYGMTTTSQIDEEMKKAVSPILHSKFMKTAEKMFKVAISAALRYNIDINNDVVGDMKMECTIDPKALLGSEDPHVKGNRLIVFDDLERCHAGIKEVMGYINYYVEHIGCNVVIVGDDDKLNKKQDFQEIKEKTIGREFELDPEIDAAVECFVCDENIIDKDYLTHNTELIKACFKASRTNNLRLLKQSLCDFSLMMGRIPTKTKQYPTFEKIKQRLLANFVAVYAEDKGQEVNMDDYGRKLGEEFSDQMIIDLTGEEKPVKTEMTKKHEKYNVAGLTDKYNAMVPHYADFVLEYLRKGRVDLSFIETEIKKDEKKPWEVLQNYMSLENDVLTRNVDLNAGYLQNGEFGSVDEMLSSAFIMLMIIHWELTPKYNAETVSKWCAKTMRKKYYGSCKSQNELHDMRQHVMACVGYYVGDQVLEVKTFLIELGKVYAEIEGKLKNDLTVFLETLSDGKIEELYNVYNGVMPDHSTTYSLSPIFARVDPEKFVNGFVGLSNEGKRKVISLIVGHYSDALNIRNPEDMVYHYVDDLKTLPEIIGLLEKQEGECQLVDKMLVKMLKKNLEESVKKIKAADAVRKGEQAEQ